MKPSEKIQKHWTRGIPYMPKAVPDGKIVVHNHVVPVHPVGLNGFRVWLAELAPEYVVCKCDWAPHLPVHYCTKTYPFWGGGEGS